MHVTCGRLAVRYASSHYPIQHANTLHTHTLFIFTHSTSLSLSVKVETAKSHLRFWT